MFLTACDAVDPRMCTAEFRFGVTVRVIDSGSGAALPTDSVSIAVTEGAFVDSLRVPSEIAERGIGLAGERSGTYSVRSFASGYQVWEESEVRVTADECHVLPVSLTARMIPE
jgi:hypothetical protein